MNVIQQPLPYSTRDLLPVMAYPMPWQSQTHDCLDRIMGLAQPAPTSAAKAMYIHIPFCEYLCSFCPFVKYPKNEAKVTAYLAALKREIDHYASSTYGQSIRFGSLYMGGGTASSLSTAQLVDLITYCRTRFNFEHDAEITLESNPTTVNVDKLRAVAQAGVNRISFGVQTFNDAIGAETDVDPDGKTSLQAINWALAAGIENISIDLIYNLPGQSTVDLLADINTAYQAGVKQVSLFPLAVVPQTQLFQKVRRGAVAPVGELEHEITLHLEAASLLEHLGFKQRSIPDFRQAPYDYRHSEIHFRWLEDLVGLGAGAMGIVNDYVYVNVGELERYDQLTSQNLLPVNAGVKISAEEQPRSAMILGLRQLSLSRSDFRERFGHDVNYYFASLIAALEGRSLIALDDASISLTQLGRIFGYNVAKEFYSESVRQQGQRLAERLSRRNDVQVKS
jgi:putative oxygen-independent coproporphyrinogen III oxidase